MTDSKSPPIERKWQMTRLGAGDYLLPSNDGKTIWRFLRYQEDGTSIWADTNREDRGTYWAVYRYTGRIDGSEVLDPDNWDQWEQYDSHLATRKQAIKSALGSS